MTDTEYLLQQARKCIAGLDREHACFAEMNWQQNEAALIADVAAACRDGLVTLPISGIPKHITERIALPGESPEALVKRCLAGTWRSVGENFEFPDGIDYHKKPRPPFKYSWSAVW